MPIKRRLPYGFVEIEDLRLHLFVAEIKTEIFFILNGFTKKAWQFLYCLTIASLVPLLPYIVIHRAALGLAGACKKSSNMH